MLTASSCAHSTYHTATPIQVGKNQLGAFGGAGYVSKTPGVFGSDEMGGDERGRAYPSFDLTYRRGLSSWSDIGIQVGTSLLRVDYNIALVNLENFALSINPQFDAQLRFAVGLYADVLKTPNATLTLNVTPGIQIMSGPGLASGMLLKVPIDLFSLLAFTQGEMVVQRDRDTHEWAVWSLVGGLGLAWEF